MPSRCFNMTDTPKDDDGAGPSEPRSTPETEPILPQSGAAPSPSPTPPVEHPGSSPAPRRVQLLIALNTLFAALGLADALARTIMRRRPGVWIFEMAWDLISLMGDALLFADLRGWGRAQAAKRLVRGERWHAGLAMAWLLLEAVLGQRGVGLPFTLVCAYVDPSDGVPVADSRGLVADSGADGGP